MYLVSYARFHNYDVPFCETTLLTRRNSVYSSCYGGLPECSRLRGEYSPVEKFPVFSGGRSSCLWGKLADKNRVSFMGRNIPAHAGKTVPARTPTGQCREHPRACGENTVLALRLLRDCGTSPRTRGKPAYTVAPIPSLGNIPAHAGKTWSMLPLAPTSGEHPRACGENICYTKPELAERGTSPRARGKLGNGAG